MTKAKNIVTLKNVLINLRSKKTAILLLFAAAFLVFVVSLNNPYYYDDHLLIDQNLWVKHGPPGGWLKQFYMENTSSFHGFRPLLMASYEWTSRVFGHEVYFHRSLNLLLHLGNAILGYLILVQFFPKARLTAFAAATIFLIHPINTIVVNFIWKRSSSLSLLFLLLGIHVFMHEWKRKTFDHRWTLLHVLFMLAGLGAKELGLLYLGIAGCFFVGAISDKNAALSGSDRRSFLKVYGVRLLSLLLLSILYYWRRMIWIRPMEQHISYMHSQVRYVPRSDFIINSGQSFWEYLYWAIFPNPLVLNDPEYTFRLLPFVCMVLLLLFSGFWAFSKRHWVWPSLSFVFVWGSLIFTHTYWVHYTRQDQIRMYFLLLVFSAGAAFFLRWLFGYLRPSLSKFSWLILFFLFAGMSFAQNLRYQDEILIWEDVVERYPNSQLGWENLAAVHFLKGNYTHAFVAYRKLLALDPNLSSYRLRKIQSELAFRGLSPDFKSEIIRDLEIIEAQGVAHQDEILFSTIQIILGDLEPAKMRLLSLVERFPYLSGAHYNLGRIFQLQGDLLQARRAYQNVLKIDPGHTAAQKALLELHEGLPKHQSS